MTAIAIEITARQGYGLAVQILRGFDQARRQLARELVGHEGAGTGLDNLTFAPATSLPAPGTPVSILAWVIDQRHGQHRVEYAAVSVRGPYSTLLAHAKGTTAHRPAVRVKQPEPPKSPSPTLEVTNP